MPDTSIGIDESLVGVDREWILQIPITKVGSTC